MEKKRQRFRAPSKGALTGNSGIGDLSTQGLPKARMEPQIITGFLLCCEGYSFVQGVRKVWVFPFEEVVKDKAAGSCRSRLEAWVLNYLARIARKGWCILQQPQRSH